MDVEAHDDIGRHDERHRRIMHGEDRDEQRKKAAVYQRLQRTYRKGGQKVRRSGLMMDLVDPAINRFLMHPPMQPVEPSVEEKKIKRVFKSDDPPGGGMGIEGDVAVRRQECLDRS